jgi:hypothetical protein
VLLNAGKNIIQFGNPTSYPPDIDQIVISGNGHEPESEIYGLRSGKRYAEWLG